MPELANHVMDYLNGDDLKNEIVGIIDKINASKNEQNQITKYSEALIVDLYKTALEHANFIEHESLAKDEIIEMQQRFKEQLGFWWIELQSEWIRLNNLLNYKIAIHNEVDPILQGKSSVCSVFLGPIAGFLDKNDLDNNMDYLKGLIERSQYEGVFSATSSSESS